MRKAAEFHRFLLGWAALSCLRTHFAKRLACASTTKDTGPLGVFHHARARRSARIELGRREQVEQTRDIRSCHKGPTGGNGHAARGLEGRRDCRE